VFTNKRTLVLFIRVIAAILLVAAALPGCGGGAKDRSAEVTQLWAADPGSADWDMTIRGVVAQQKSTGEHMAAYTIYLTTFSSKQVPGFAAYQTIDVPNSDSMSFEGRVTSFFAVVAGDSLFPGVQDPQGFMQWYSTNMQGNYFIRLQQITDESGKNTWNLIAADKEPVSSTMVENAGTEIPLVFDEATAIGTILTVVLLFTLAGCDGDTAGSGATVSVVAAPEPRVVTATGDASVKVAPDEVVVTFGVETEDPQLEAAKAQNDDIVRQVLDQLKGFGVADDHIQTEYMGISPSYDYPSYAMPRLKGYNVQKTIVVTLSDLSKFEDLLSGVLSAGANYVHNVEFQTTELRKYRDQARALAIQAAKEKATALAGELGQELGEPVTITEEQSSWQSWYGYGWGSGLSGNQTQNVVVQTASTPLAEGATVAPGQISVNARVSVTFALK
jgi:uncharacterized protein YggE